MLRYRTEIHVAPDRYVCLQLPDYLPEGKATVTVTVATEESSAFGGEADDHHRHDDIEWWEEFDEDEADHKT